MPQENEKPKRRGRPSGTSTKATVQGEPNSGNKLSPAGVNLVIEYLIAGEPNGVIREALAKAGQPTIGNSALSRYRKDPRVKEGLRMVDLEVLQIGAARAERLLVETKARFEEVCGLFNDPEKPLSLQDRFAAIDKMIALGEYIQKQVERAMAAHEDEPTPADMTVEHRVGAVEMEWLAEVIKAYVAKRERSKNTGENSGTLGP